MWIREEGTFVTISRIRGTDDRSWAARGACTQLDPDGFFVQGADQQKIKTACQGCPVRMECLADALDNRIEFGVWGGMTERERRRLLRQHPGIQDWYAVLDRTAARASGD
ncbi:WhiB family transcriptional regulator [Brachybacterium endophyticum]|uniref:Transcriptional regulator WhiB n=1 Tax=Brachybacterium endophyticum TaxID=2182385 RepID=A0A2U2RKU5_9MICO|nr:WhiB family transcriptional regulator [Brachybacterium endophyticum]PWH06498.1 WhiB family transcriptional regulator [Brachybacterium endophyticum]